MALVQRGISAEGYRITVAVMGWNRDTARGQWSSVYALLLSEERRIKLSTGDTG